MPMKNLLLRFCLIPIIVYTILDLAIRMILYGLTFCFSSSSDALRAHHADVAEGRALLRECFDFLIGREDHG